MNKHHREILRQIKQQPAKKSNGFNLPGYLGSPHELYYLATPQKRKIAKTWAREHSGMSLAKFVDVLSSLYQGKSYEERTIAGLLLGYMPTLRKKLSLDDLCSWLGHLKGWAEIDTTCQSNFSAQEILKHWEEWQKLLAHLSKDKDINKRRASLVLLVKPVREAADARLLQQAFNNIHHLQEERDILITKAISWLLREMIKNYRSEVKTYLKDNKTQLPKIALRETLQKLRAGKKS